MNAQDREDLRDLNKKFDGFLDAWNKKKTDDAGFHATMKLKVEDIDDHENRLRELEYAERKTIVIASLVGAVVTGGGGLVLLYLSTVI